ncbi:hypothetical protein BDZ91DRAFT_766555 [Kalaharituber pfeilii]|nr:hypothetical protein BDZ91DRAFT_766555 [Kalaharituber pfeilii]
MLKLENEKEPVVGLNVLKFKVITVRLVWVTVELKLLSSLFMISQAAWDTTQVVPGWHLVWDELSPGSVLSTGSSHHPGTAVTLSNSAVSSMPLSMTGEWLQRLQPILPSDEYEMVGKQSFSVSPPAWPEPQIPRASSMWHNDDHDRLAAVVLVAA